MSGPDRQSGLAYDSSAFSTYPCDPGPPPPRKHNNRFKGEKVKIHVAIHCHVQSCVHVNDANFGWSFYIHAHMYMYMYHLHVHVGQSLWCMQVQEVHCKAICFFSVCGLQYQNHHARRSEDLQCTCGHHDG